MAELFRESFDNLIRWVSTGGPSNLPTIGAARNGNGLILPSTATQILNTIPAVSESDTVTIGFALNPGAIGGTRIFCELWSDTPLNASGTLHNRWQINASGAFEVTRGATILGTSATGLAVAGTWSY